MNKALLIHRATIERKERLSGKGLSSNFVKKYDHVPCMVEPASVGDTLHQDLIIGKDYNAYFSVDVDIKKGDRLTTSNGLSLLVNALAVYNDVPNLSHIEATCSTIGD